MHNDYVTGGLELAARTGAPYVVPAGSGVGYGHVEAGEGSVFDVGLMRPRVMHTPGTLTTTSATSWRIWQRAVPAVTGECERCSRAGRCCTARPGGPTS